HSVSRSSYQFVSQHIYLIISAHFHPDISSFSLSFSLFIPVRFSTHLFLKQKRSFSICFYFIPTLFLTLILALLTKHFSIMITNVIYGLDPSFPICFFLILILFLALHTRSFLNSFI